MEANDSQLTLTELYQLGAQLERDRDEPLQALRQRDHGIGDSCPDAGDSERLRYWLQRVGGGEGEAAEQHLVLLLRLLSLVFGFATMAGFLLASGRGLVNVFLFLGLFVLLQLLLSLTGAWVLGRSLGGVAPGVSLFNPLRPLLARLFPQRELLRPCLAATRLSLLRYNAESGLLFVIGALVGYLLLLAFSDFTFVWGSTFGLSDRVVEAITGAMALPWSAWLPQALPSPELIAASRYHPALGELSRQELIALRDWWPFLLLAMLAWGLLPRLLLWWCARRACRRELQRAFVSYPGAAAVLSRMRAPVVRTQAREPEDRDGPGALELETDADLVLLDWAGALAAGGDTVAAQLQGVAPQQRFAAGSGTPREDREVLAQINNRAPQQLLVLVRAWEPPMADLADLLTGLESAGHCSLGLVPLPGRTVSEANLAEWRNFAAQLPQPQMEARALRGA